MSTCKIHLIRHGQTQQGAEGRYIGVTDVPLSSEGKNELTHLKNTFGYPEADVVYSSPLVRSLQTARILYPETELVLLKGLREYNFGSFEGKTMQELKGDPVFEGWISGTGEKRPPQGETGPEFVERVCNAFSGMVRDVFERGCKEAVMISHAGVISTLLALYAFPRHPQNEWRMEPGLGYTILVTPQLWMRDEIVEAIGYLPLGIEEALEQENE